MSDLHARPIFVSHVVLSIQLFFLAQSDPFSGCDCLHPQALLIVQKHGFDTFDTFSWPADSLCVNILVLVAPLTRALHFCSKQCCIVAIFPHNIISSWHIAFFVYGEILFYIECCSTVLMVSTVQLVSLYMDLLV
jgi:hypothetical protein